MRDMVTCRDVPSPKMIKVSEQKKSEMSKKIVVLCKKKSSSLTTMPEGWGRGRKVVRTTKKLPLF